MTRLLSNGVWLHPRNSTTDSNRRTTGSHLFIADFIKLKSICMMWWCCNACYNCQYSITFVWQQSIKLTTVYGISSFHYIWSKHRLVRYSQWWEDKACLRNCISTQLLDRGKYAVPHLSIDPHFHKQSTLCPYPSIYCYSNIAICYMLYAIYIYIHILDRIVLTHLSVLSFHW